IYGVSAWGLELKRTQQQNLVITREDEPTVTVDNIEARSSSISCSTTKRFATSSTPSGRRACSYWAASLKAAWWLRERLRDLGYVPMVFNFDKPETKDFSETVRLLASLSKFVIVDITNPRSAPLELQATVPDYMV